RGTPAVGFAARHSAFVAKPQRAVLEPREHAVAGSETLLIAAGGPAHKDLLRAAIVPVPDHAAADRIRSPPLGVGAGQRGERENSEKLCLHLVADSDCLDLLETLAQQLRPRLREASYFGP